MEQFRIKVGDYNLIDSGTVITTKDDDVHFFIRDLEYVFRFVKTDEDDAKVHIASNDGKKMEIELQNFDNPFGVGNINPMIMGEIDGNDLFIMFRINQLNDGGKTMHKRKKKQFLN